MLPSQQLPTTSTGSRAIRTDYRWKTWTVSRHRSTQGSPKSRWESKTRTLKEFGDSETSSYNIKHSPSPSQNHIKPLYLSSFIRYVSSFGRKKIAKHIKKQEKNTLGRDKVIIRTRLWYNTDAGIMRGSFK